MEESHIEVTVDPIVRKSIDFQDQKEKTKGRAPIDIVKYNPGFKENVVDLTECAEEHLQKLLLPGETILQEFSCYYPKPRRSLPTVIFLTLITFGIYLLFIIFEKITNFLAKMNICLPYFINMKRGKLLITSQGRIICWKESAYQVKKRRNIIWWLFSLFMPTLCAAPTSYVVNDNVKVYSGKNIREVCQYSFSVAECLCCGHNFRTGVQIFFNNYGYDSPMGIVSTHPSFSFLLQNVVNIIFNWSLVLGDFLQSTETVIVTTGSGDAKYGKREMWEAAMNDAATFCSFLMKRMRVDDAILCYNNHQISPQTLQSQEICGTTLVDANLNIKIPTKWLALTDDEKIVSSTSEIPYISTFDFILCFLTIGIYYFVYLSRRLKTRAAFVLTTKKIVCLSLINSDYRIPEDLNYFVLDTRFLFPGKINGGFLTSSSSVNLESCIRTEGSAILFHFTDVLKSLPFARALHMSTERMAHPSSINFTKETSQIQDLTPSGHSLSSWIPLLPDEKHCQTLSTNEEYVPFLYDPYSLSMYTLIESLRNGEEFQGASPFCSKDNFGFLFPWLPLLLTLGYYPLKGNTTLIASKYTLYQIKSAANNGLWKFLHCCCGCIPPRRVISVTWAPITEYCGQDVSVSTRGDDTIYTRLAQHTIFQLCFPMRTSRFEVRVFLKKFFFSIIGHRTSTNCFEDNIVEESVQLLHKLDSTIGDVESG